MNDLPHFLYEEIANCPIDKAAFSVLPVPYEKTVSYGEGTAEGPASILKASNQLELWDGYSTPGLAGIHTCEVINCSQSEDAVINNIADATKTIVSNNSMPVVLGGEHTVTFGVIKGLIAAGLKDFGVVQIDAHADLRDAYEGNPLSHASVMKRVIDEGIPVHQLGIRALCEEEVQCRMESPLVSFQDADVLVPQHIMQVTLPENFPDKVFFTLDIYGMDPSVFPSTGTPVPGGLSWYQTLSLFESVCQQRDIVGFDLMEFAPIKDFHAYDFSAALLVYKMMGIVERAKQVQER